jgi:DNA-binding transcriptional LysR family regulator
MDLRQLAAVVAVADNRTFSAAADALHTVQSNVSSHVARLEAELGVQLIDRHDQRLTEEGQAVVERARRIQAELDALIADVAALRSEVVGTVRLGMISTTARWLTPLLLDELAASHPRVRLVVFEGTTTTLEPAVAGGAIDAAVVNLPTTNRELVARPLFDEDLVLVVAGDNPLARRTSVDFATLSGLALLLPAAGTAYRDELDDAASAAGVTLTARAELDGLRLIASLAWRGYGPAILPASAVAAEGDGYVSLPVSGLPPRRVGAVVRRGRPSAPTRVALELLERLTATAPETATRLGLQPPRPAS